MVAVSASADAGGMSVKSEFGQVGCEPKAIDAAVSPKDRFSKFGDWMSKLQSRPSHRPNLRFPEVIRDFILPRGWVIFQNHSQRVYRAIGTAD